MSLLGNRVRTGPQGFGKARPDAGVMKRRLMTRRQALVEVLESRTMLSVTAININAINPKEGVPLGLAIAPAQIATFTVNNYIGVDESSEYSGLISWGDGTQSAGLGPVTITFLANLGNGDASYAVNSYHTYAEATTTANPYSLTVTIDDNTGPGTNQSQSGPVVVSDVPLTAAFTPTPVTATVGTGLTNLTVGQFIDANPLATASNYSVQVNWGDGQFSAGTVVPYKTSTQLGGTGVEFTVEASHTYTTTGTFTVSTSINDIGGVSVTELLPVTVIQPMITAIHINPINPTEGIALGSAAAPVQIATFTVSGYTGVDESSRYSALINWGDGGQSAGLGNVTIQFVADLGSGNASYGVYSYHTYAEATTTANPYSLAVTVADNTGYGTTQSQSGPVAVNEAALSSSFTPTPVSATVGTGLTNLTVAQFIDANPLAKASDYSAQVNWGDGQFSAGTIVPFKTATQLSGTGVEFTVEASHIYTTAGSYTVTTSINDVEGASVTETLPVTVTGAALQQGTAAPVNAVEGIPFTGTVASFVDPNPADTASSFTATINWGNGDSTAGSVVASATSSFIVTAVDPVSGKGYAYREEGIYTTSVSIKGPSGEQSTVFSTATVADAPLTATGVTVVIPPAQNALFTGQIATFTDADPNGTLTDYTSSINWGDGVVTTGTITLSPTTPGLFVVSGTHQYAPSSIPYQATITVKDVGGSTATAISSITVFVPLSVTGKLNPASDSGVSSSDAITNVVQPNFIGTTSQPDATVTLYAQPLPGGVPFAIGQVASDFSGAWSITTNQVLPDGSYAITAVAVNTAGHITSDTTSITPNLVIDTAGPRVTGVSFSRFTGQIILSLQDFGGPSNAGVGINLATLADANNYSFIKANAAHPEPFKVNVISITPGTTAGSQLVTLTLNDGHSIRGGHYLFTVRSVSPTDLTGVQDIAGNALDGEFYGTFPSGNNHVGGDFVAELDAKHHIISSPQTVIGGAAPLTHQGPPPPSILPPAIAHAGKQTPKALHVTGSRSARLKSPVVHSLSTAAVAPVTGKTADHRASRTSSAFDRGLHEIANRKRLRS